MAEWGVGPAVARSSRLVLYARRHNLVVCTSRARRLVIQPPVTIVGATDLCAKRRFVRRFATTFLKYMKRNFRNITINSFLVGLLLSASLFSTPVYAQNFGDLSYGNGDLSYGNGDLSYGNGDLSYGNGDLSYGNGDLSYGNGDLSYGNGDLSYGNGDLSYGNGDLSYGDQYGDLSYGNYYQGQTNSNPYYGGGTSYGGGSTIVNNNYANARSVSYGGGGSMGGGSRTQTGGPYYGGGSTYGGGSVYYGGGSRMVQPPLEAQPYIYGTVYTDQYSMNTQPTAVYTNTYAMNTAPVSVHTNAYSPSTDNYCEFYGQCGSTSSQNSQYARLDQSNQLALGALPYTGIDEDPLLKGVLYFAFFSVVAAITIRFMVRFAENSLQ